MELKVEVGEEEIRRPGGDRDLNERQGNKKSKRRESSQGKNILTE